MQETHLDSFFDHCLTINCLLILVPGVGCQTGVIELVVLVLASRRFSPGTPVFRSPQKQTFPNSNPDSYFIWRVSLIRQVLCAKYIDIYMNLLIYLYCFNARIFFFFLLKHTQKPNFTSYSRKQNDVYQHTNVANE